MIAPGSSASLALLLGLSALACGAPENQADFVTRQEALHGGNILSETNSLRSGAVTILTSPDTESCSGTIVATSGIRQETWVLTAAHCTCEGASFVRRPEGPEGTALGGGGVSFRHPSHICGKSDRDIALMRFPFGIPVKNDRGEWIEEHYRPILTSNPIGNSNVPFAAFGNGMNEAYQPGKCTYLGPDGVANDFTNRWAASTFNWAGLSGDIVNTTPFEPAGSALLWGDSGGGWLTSSSITEDTVLSRGVLAGVSKSLSCFFGTVTNTATTTWDPSNLAFLTSTLGPNFHGSATTTWLKTCDINWCQYSDAERASLLAAVL